MKKEGKAVIYALLAALLYSVNIPLSKILLEYTSPCMLSSLLYFGAALSVLIPALFRKKEKSVESKIRKRDLPFLIAMVVLDTAAPILLYTGLKEASGSLSSLISNSEIALTMLIATIIFKEKVSKRSWAAILLITVSTVILSFSREDDFLFSPPLILVFLASLSWSFENNCTRALSSKDTFIVVFIKGLFSSLGSLLIALSLKEPVPGIKYILYALALGALAYGLSIYFYIRAQRIIGAGRTSAFYAVNPFIGSLLSFFIFKESITARYLIALPVMTIGTYLLMKDTLGNE